MTPTIAVATDGSNPIKSALFSAVDGWGEVLILDPEREHPDLLDHDLDLYHMARRRGPLLADLRRACEVGIETVNAYEEARTLVDRQACEKMLADAGLRTPATQYGQAEGIDLDPPLIAKPRYELGPLRHQVEVLADGELDFDGEHFVQEYVPHEESIKLYQLGTETRAVTGVEASRQPTREREATEGLCAIADRIRERTGLELFEVDLVAGEEDYYVVDVNAAVSMRGASDGYAAYETLLYDRVQESIGRRAGTAVPATAVEQRT
jgi:glutathione synthase/RimK-type ligase-like ATP-grasp enzyme